MVLVLLSHRIFLLLSVFLLFGGKRGTQARHRIGARTTVFAKSRSHSSPILRRRRPPNSKYRDLPVKPAIRKSSDPCRNHSRLGARSATPITERQAGIEPRASLESWHLASPLCPDFGA